ncbi:CvpA family protein [Chloroflexota bacterium]
MIFVSLLALFIIVVSTLAGLKEGAAKHAFNLLITIVVIPLAGKIFWQPASWLSFLPGEHLPNFLGFFITLGVLSAISQLVLLIPRKIVQGIWKHLPLYHLLGGVFNFVSAGIGLALLYFVTRTFPFWPWLADAITGAGVMRWAAGLFGFVENLLPAVFQSVGALVSFF